MTVNVMKVQRVFAAAIWCMLALPPVAAFLEGRLLSHVLVQLPALVLCGYVLGLSLRTRVARASDIWNRGGATGIAVAIPAAAIWMLPRAVDASLESAWVELAKFVTVPLLVGLPLALSVPRFGPITIGFLKAHFVSMALFLGWLFSAAPVRLCNNYLADDQALVGAAWLAIAATAMLGWTVPLFFDSRQRGTASATASNPKRGRPYAVLRNHA